MAPPHDHHETCARVTYAAASPTSPTRDVWDRPHRTAQSQTTWSPSITRALFEEPRATLTDLQPGSTVNVTVIANSIAGSSSSSPIEAFQLAPPRHPEPPSSLRAGPAINGISPAVHLSIVWDRPESSGLPILRYELRVDGDEPMAFPTLPRYTLLNLEPVTNYTFQVRAESEAGWGPLSEHLTLTTELGEPPARPLQPRLGQPVQGVSNITSLFITWNAPRSPAWPVTGYELVVYDSNLTQMANLSLNARTSYLYRCARTAGQVRTQLDVLRDVAGEELSRLWRAVVAARTSDDGPGASAACTWCARSDASWPLRDGVRRHSLGAAV